MRSLVSRVLWMQHRPYSMDAKLSASYAKNIRNRTRQYHVSTYFSKFPGETQSIPIRGQEPVNAIVGSARLEVCAVGKKRFVIALKYPGEKEYRYLVATNLNWRTVDLIQAYSLRSS